MDRDIIESKTVENNNAQRNTNNIICIMYLNQLINTYILL
jgi:hypothetical protein